MLKMLPAPCWRHQPVTGGKASVVDEGQTSCVATRTLLARTQRRCGWPTSPGVLGCRYAGHPRVAKARAGGEKSGGVDPPRDGARAAPVDKLFNGTRQVHALAHIVGVALGEEDTWGKMVPMNLAAAARRGAHPTEPLPRREVSAWSL
jgi:hypothetical protein